MRWKLLRRRWTISAPRVIVQRHLPWPLRWAVAALMLGFSAAIALWAFEFGKDIAGLDRDAKEELTRLRTEGQQLRSDRDKAQSIANTAESLLKAERATQERLGQQLRQLESDNLSLKADLGFFEGLLPSSGSAGLEVRALQMNVQQPGQLRFQLLLMQSGKSVGEFVGQYELTLIGTLEGKPWSLTAPGGPWPVRVKTYARLTGQVELPSMAVVKTVQVRVSDNNGVVRVTHQARP